MQAFYNKRIFLILIPIILLFTLDAFSQEPNAGLKLIKAIETTLTKQPAILLQEQKVENNKGLFQEAEGTFDLTIESNMEFINDKTPLNEENKSIYGVDSSDSFTTNYQVSLNKLLHTGVIVKPNLQISSTNDRSLGNITQNEASVNFTLVIPLLKGRGRKVTEANLMAIENVLEASELELSHSISQSIFNTGAAYWNLLGFLKKLDILKDSENRALKMVQDVKQLIDADERPPSDLDHLQANLSDKIAARFSAEEELYSAHQELGLAMGLNFDEISSLPYPIEPFPAIHSKEVLLYIYNKEEFLNLSKSNRTDLLAMKKKEISEETLLQAAKANQKPFLDLYLDIGYKGLEEGETETGLYKSLYNSVGGLNYSLLLSYKYPIGNNTSKALVRKHSSIYNQTRIQRLDMERRITSDVSVALENLSKSIKGLQEAQKSVSIYKKVVDNEKIKLRIGMSTVIDLVTVEDRLTNALLSEVDFQQKYASALLQLRYATGTLLSIKDDQFVVDMEHLINIPSIK